MTETPSPIPPLDPLRICCEALEDKKASDLMILDVSEKSSITNHIVVASGMSEPHLRALRIAVELACKENGIQIIGEAKDHNSGWIVVDAFDFMVHILIEEKREFFSIETLWKDAERVSV
ncbi:MAG: ribosome silencing factor [Opitutales bacterium]